MVGLREIVTNHCDAFSDGVKTFFRDRDICQDTAGVETQDEPRHFGLG